MCFTMSNAVESWEKLQSWAIILCWCGVTPLTIQIVIWPIVDTKILMRSACCYIENAIDWNWKESRKMYLWLLLMSFWELVLFLWSDMGVTQYFPDSSHSDTEPIFGLKHTFFLQVEKKMFSQEQMTVLYLFWRYNSWLDSFHTSTSSFLPPLYLRDHVCWW